MKMAVVLKIVLMVLLQIYQSHEVCYLGGDIAFVLDISETASVADLIQIRMFGKEITEFMSNNGRTLMALVTYRCEALLRFSFDDWTSSMSQDLLLDIFPYLRATGNQTHHGMDLLRQNVFSEDNGARAKTDKVAILVTDRPSSDIPEAESRAARLKADGVVIFAVVIGNVVTDEEIQKYTVHFVRIVDFSQLEVAFNTLKSMAFDCSPCPDGWIKSKPEDDNCYKLVTTPMPWKTAQDHCDTIRNGSQLIQFHNAAQVDWFVGEYTDTGLTDMWVGLRRGELTGNFVYSDSSALDTSVVSWAEGAPTNGACVCHSKNGLQDDNCDELLQSVCQIDMSAR